MPPRRPDAADGRRRTGDRSQANRCMRIGGKTRARRTPKEEGVGVAETEFATEGESEIDAGVEAGWGGVVGGELITWKSMGSRWTTVFVSALKRKRLVARWFGEELSDSTKGCHCCY
ncbi:hypothetical protein NL676_010968 [Syzygium grande]|nr:hypothetical protein NL676_010968 [Syzygium grande]